MSSGVSPRLLAATRSALPFFTTLALTLPPLGASGFRYLAALAVFARQRSPAGMAKTARSPFSTT
jgi:hypothetical protein